MSNITSLPGVRSYTSEPNPQLVEMLRDLLARAEAGQLQSMIATGFMLDGTRMASWADFHDNVYEMLGSAPRVPPPPSPRAPRAALARPIFLCYFPANRP